MGAWEVLTTDPRARLVDVRTRAEWNYVGVPDLSALGGEVALVEWLTFPDGMLNPSFVEDLRGLTEDLDAPLFFLCRSGVRSAAAAQEATAAGFSQAYNVLDGFEGSPDESGHRGLLAGWKAVGLPWRQS